MDESLFDEEPEASFPEDAAFELLEFDGKEDLIEAIATYNEEYELYHIDHSSRGTGTGRMKERGGRTDRTRPTRRCWSTARSEAAVLKPALCRSGLCFGFLKSSGGRHVYKCRVYITHMPSHDEEDEKDDEKQEEDEENVCKACGSGIALDD